MQTLEDTTAAATSVGKDAQVQQSTRADEVVISVRNVSKHFGKNEPTVRDLNFQVQRGQIFCLLGPSGSGKSTTMRMLTGVYKPSEGELRVLGAEPSHFKKRTRTRIGYMPQQFVLFPELTTLENINFMASVYGMSWFGRRAKVQQALEFVDLWQARNTLAVNLSGGMQRRLELASTLVHRPDLIFVDEPTAGIDPILRAKFWEHFKSLSAEGRSLFVTTQYVTEADYCDVVAILSRGRLLSIGTPEAIRREAMGGEILDLSLPEITSQTVRLLRNLPEMRRIRILSSENLRLTVSDATETLKEIVTLFQENNIEIQSIQPYRPDFEEVFVQLMEQDAKEHPEEQQEENGKHKDKHQDKHKEHSSKEGHQAAQLPSQLNAATLASEPNLERDVRQNSLSQLQSVPTLVEQEKRAEVVEAFTPVAGADGPAQVELVQPTPMDSNYAPQPPQATTSTNNEASNLASQEIPSSNAPSQPFVFQSDAADATLHGIGPEPNNQADFEQNAAQPAQASLKKQITKPLKVKPTAEPSQPIQE